MTMMGGGEPFGGGSGGGTTTSSPVYSGEVTGQDFKATGLTGATAASRYVGATTTAAPVAGTFAVGDFVIAEDGNIWICTVAGTPGTWANSGSAGSSVTSVFGRSGAITANTGDYTVAKVTGAAPLASPALTGVPTAPTAAALTNTTQLATTAFDTAAVAVETSRATTAEALLAPIASPTFTGITTAPEFSASGLTGAVAASRYVGATASAAPASGTFAKGDFVIAQNGHIFVCTTAGTPGTWADIGATGNLVTSVFTRTGAVVATTGDYTVAQVTGAAPLGSPALTGIPTAPTAAALTSTTQLATTNYADLAVGVETTRATTAEALLAPLASPALTGSPTAPTQTAGDNTTKLATDAFVTTAVNNAIAGVNPAIAVQAATAAILPNTPTYSNGVSGIGATLTSSTTNVTLVVDGYTPVLNDRILVKTQASALQNGVYTVTQLAALGLAWILTRALDYDTPSDINNTGAIPVVNGTANATTSWVLTSAVTTVGTDSLTFTQFSLAPTTLVTLTGTQTLTNKRITKRYGSTASSATPTINTDNVDIYELTAQAVSITSFTTNLSGTPNTGDTLQIRITDNSTPQAITWGTSFEASTVSLPTTTVASALLTVGFNWNNHTTKWRCVAVA